VKVYPGADEVGLSMLSKLTVSTMAAIHEARDTDTFQDIQLPDLAPPGLTLVFRDPNNSSLYLIPNYEGQPMIYTLLDQIAAAGGVPIPNNWTAPSIAAYEDSRGHAFPRYYGTPLPNVTLLVNNFNDTPQIEAPNQPPGRSVNDYSMFTPWACGGAAQQTSILSFVDNRYSNGTHQTHTACIRATYQPSTAYMVLSCRCGYRVSTVYDEPCIDVLVFFAQCYQLTTWIITGSGGICRM
jgi:hypothetical protein